MANRVKDILLVKVKVPFFRYKNFDNEQNDIILLVEKDMTEKRREAARLRMIAQNWGWQDTITPNPKFEDLKSET